MEFWSKNSIKSDLSLTKRERDYHLIIYSVIISNDSWLNPLSKSQKIPHPFLDVYIPKQIFICMEKQNYLKCQSS